MVTPSSVLFFLLVRKTDLGYEVLPTEFPAVVTERSSKLRCIVEVGYEMIVDFKAEIRLLNAILKSVYNFYSSWY
jgi:hypothetical protein